MVRSWIIPIFGVLWWINRSSFDSESDTKVHSMMELVDGLGEQQHVDGLPAAGIHVSLTLRIQSWSA